MSTIFLIGFPCCGKSTLGVELARALNCEFIDLDEFLEHESGKSIMDIYHDCGEEYFRTVERNALHELSHINGIVACGGGTPCTDGNMELMNAKGITVWLTTSPECLIARLCLPEHRAKRPAIANLTDDEIAAYVHDVLAERTPYYSKARLHFDSTRIETAQETVETARCLAEILSSHFVI